MPPVIFKINTAVPVHMRDVYDVVVVGAGPAGLSSAKAAKEAGASVLVVEEHAAIGSPVQCGEGVNLPYLKDWGFTGKEGWIWGGIRDYSLHAPSGKAIRFKTSVEEPMLFIVERKVLEKYVAVKLAKMGVHVFTKARATGLVIENGVVKGVNVDHLGEDKEVRAGVVVAADGPISTLGRQAGLKPYHEKKKFDSGAQFQMAGIDISGRELEVHFASLAPKGYVWIFPKGDGFANVGIALDPAQGRALDNLREFVERDPRLKGGSIVEVNAGPIPTYGYSPRLVGDGIMLVGDSARQVNPFSGGGIVLGHEAGKIAGRVAAEAARKGNVSAAALEEYPRLYTKKWFKEYKRAYGRKEMIYNLEPTDLDKLADAVGTVEVPAKYKDFLSMRFFIFKKLMPKLLKNVGLVMKARKAMKQYGMEEDDLDLDDDRTWGG